MILHHSSGSSCSARSIEPLTSANRTVTCLRSASSWMASFTAPGGYAPGSVPCVTTPILRGPIDWSINGEACLRVAAVQLNSNGDKGRNLAAAERLVREAAADGAEFVAMPEKWNLLAGGEELVAGAEPLDGPSLTAARGWARTLGIHLIAGSICERGGEGE